VWAGECGLARAGGSLNYAAKCPSVCFEGNTMGGRIARDASRNSDLRCLAAVLGKRLRRLRAKLGLTQRAAAARIGVGPRVLRCLERGSANPSLAVLVSTARAFGVPLSRLLRNKE
jgi:DNA-binding XRE family transcriptional regulator